jgi:ketosteroid isomerase-like protein
MQQFPPVQPASLGNAMSLRFPQPITNYLAAVNAKDTDLLADCFAEDAVVQDEGRQYRGLDAIRSWSQETQTKYKYALEALDGSVSGKTVKLSARLTGDFAGSPIELNYLFTLANDKIISLEIG